jgi:hypothetical protein
MRDHIQNYVEENDIAVPQSTNKAGKFGTLQDIVCNFLFNDTASGALDNMALQMQFNKTLS